MRTALLLRADVDFVSNHAIGLREGDPPRVTLWGADAAAPR
jgi:hypothetical protein